MSQVPSCPFSRPPILAFPVEPGSAARLHWKARQLREGHSGCESGDGAEQGEGEAPGKPAVTALALISQLQSQLEREPAHLRALLTQAGKTFLS